MDGCVHTADATQLDSFVASAVCIGHMAAVQMLQRRGGVLNASTSCGKCAACCTQHDDNYLVDLCGVSALPRLRSVAGRQKLMLDAIYRRQRQLTTS